MSDITADNPGTNFDTPVSKEQQVTASVSTEQRKSVKRLIRSPILFQYSQPTKKSKPKSESSVSSVSEEPDMTDMANISVVDEPMGEATQFVSVPMLPDDISRVAFELKPIMLPEMRLIVKDDIKELIDNAVKAINDTTKAEVASLKAENAILRAENEHLKAKVNDLEQRMVAVELNSDAQEQYGRRNCLRISGISESANENTDRIVLAIAEDLNVPLTQADIDRSHRVGKPIRGGRQIIVKFATYRARQALFEERKKLTQIQKYSNVFINEDLTARRSKLLYDARQIKRTKKLMAAYSSSGKIVVIDNANKRHVIDSDDALEAFRRQAPRPDTR